MLINVLIAEKEYWIDERHAKDFAVKKLCKCAEVKSTTETRKFAEFYLQNEFRDVEEFLEEWDCWSDFTQYLIDKGVIE